MQLARKKMISWVLIVAVVLASSGWYYFQRYKADTAETLVGTRVQMVDTAKNPIKANVPLLMHFKAKVRVCKIVRVVFVKVSRCNWEDRNMKRVAVTGNDGSYNVGTESYRPLTVEEAKIVVANLAKEKLGREINSDESTRLDRLIAKVNGTNAPTNTEVEGYVKEAFDGYVPPATDQEVTIKQGHNPIQAMLGIGVATGAAVAAGSAATAAVAEVSSINSVNSANDTTITRMGISVDRASALGVAGAGLGVAGAPAISGATAAVVPTASAATIFHAGAYEGAMWGMGLTNMAAAPVAATAELGSYAAAVGAGADVVGPLGGSAVGSGAGTGAATPLFLNPYFWGVIAAVAILATISTKTTEKWFTLLSVDVRPADATSIKALVSMEPEIPAAAASSVDYKAAQADALNYWNKYRKLPDTKYDPKKKAVVTSSQSSAMTTDIETRADKIAKEISPLTLYFQTDTQNDQQVTSPNYKRDAHMIAPAQYIPVPDPSICLKEGELTYNASLGPNGEQRISCCDGLEPKAKPGQENMAGAGSYCLAPSDPNSDRDPDPVPFGDLFYTQFIETNSNLSDEEKAKYKNFLAAVLLYKEYTEQQGSVVANSKEAIKTLMNLVVPPTTVAQ